MSINSNNFIQHVTFEGVDFSTASSPFRSSDDCDTKSDTPYGLSTYSSLSSSYSNKFTTHFDLDHTAIIKSFKPKPFKIIRETKEERQEMIKLSNHSKQIQKRVKAKERMQVKQEIAVLLMKAPKKYIPTGIEDPNLDDRGRRRLMQKLKNRIASQQTRDQRKKHISELEEVKMHLEKANKELNEKYRLLNERNSELEELLKAVQNEKLLLIEENNELKQRGIACLDSKPMSDSRIDDPQKYFDFSEDKHEGNAPSPTLTRKNKYQGHYFNFLLGVLTICVARSGTSIQVGQQIEKSNTNIQISRDEVLESYLESLESSSVISYHEGKSESVSRGVQKKRAKKNFNEDINYYYSAAAEPQESALALYNSPEEVSHSLYSFSQLSKAPENYMISTLNQNNLHQIYEFNHNLQHQENNLMPYNLSKTISHDLYSFGRLSKAPENSMIQTLNQKNVHEVYEFKHNDLSTSFQQNYPQSDYDKASYRNSTISHNKDYQHINSINGIYQALQDNQIEEKPYHGKAMQLARAGRVSRRERASSRISLFFSLMLSILALSFVFYKLKIGKQWNQVKKYPIELWRKIVKERSENKMVKELESKVYDLYAKYFVRRSVETR